ncbi:ATP-dependent RecD-like DNA helicase [Pseudomonas sp. 21LCFQ010]|uniref:ATP-dependent DNA helicase n=1 Tax=Pseudomonas sp. 21LCFQ010 TaxID=2957506 RepID=UPI002096B1BD|nr:AAA family ATPase [Pseudomonas sp. 21LCFQ010]MCO8165225.1 ATP-dependent RecD-like DNA helicase [Pseudomonas sp. 21LCFQ010]
MNAAAPALINISVRVTSIRSANRKGCIAFGHRMDVTRGINDRSSPVVIRVPEAIARLSDIAVGAIFEVYGEVSTVLRTHGAFAINEMTLDAQDIRLVRPSGSQVIQWLGDNVKGVGEVKATRLWDALGERLYDALDNADHAAIEPIIPTEDVRKRLFNRWLEDGDAKTLRFVQDKRIPLDIARKAIRFHKKNTIAALTNDPYRLLSFAGAWSDVDKVARENFSIGLDDPRRLTAALEESLYRASEKGHTCSSLTDLQSTVASLIKPHAAPISAMSKALLAGAAVGQFVCKDLGDLGLMLFAPGAWLMERRCAQFVRDLIVTPSLQPQLFPVDVNEVIARFEDVERKHLGLPAFGLNVAQRSAVATSFSNRFSVITGGAGVGKTTVLKALYKALDTTGRPRFQMALSGRATARMIEATGEEARTIAGFMRKVTDKDMGPAPVIVIDEASMLDLVTFYRLVQKLPAECQVILVGDPYQLPPIGAGLVLHVLCGMAGVPTTELTEVKRQAKDSAIPLASRHIRDGLCPAFGSDELEDVVFLSCPDDDIIPTVLRFYEQDRENTQILSATRSCRFAGVDALNRTCHLRYADHDQQLMAENPESGEIEATGLCVGDLVMYTANDWSRNLQNGSLGQIDEIFETPRSVDLGDDEKALICIALGRATFDGVSQYILDSDVDSLELAYSITVHKAQGSQFRRVIIPVRKSRILDRTFVYTAATRAQVQVIFVGDRAAVEEAIILQPKAFSRQVGLRALLEGELSQGSGLR